MFRKTELSETEKNSYDSGGNALLIVHELFDSKNFNANLKLVCELAIHAASTIQTFCHLMSFLQFDPTCIILCM